jgi:hypothetical protein
VSSAPFSYGRPDLHQLTSSRPSPIRMAGWVQVNILPVHRLGGGLPYSLRLN